ncbi:MAG: hypothetical protein LUD19_05885 [Clostridia bacterium]|nr:hypothetical protein [Clostridia bacterium]MCD8309371.1 hypothetical protein [Clostridia bacterium]
MDAIYTAVFEKILSSCSGGGYAIIDSAEFFDAIPDGGRKAIGEVESALKYLQKTGCIDLKYARGNLYCVCPLKAALPEEPKAEEPCTTVIQVKEKMNKRCLAFYSLSAFLGGAAGSLIVCIIAAAL